MKLINWKVKIKIVTGWALQKVDMENSNELLELENIWVEFAWTHHLWIPNGHQN